MIRVWRRCTTGIRQGVLHVVIFGGLLTSSVPGRPTAASLGSPCDRLDGIYMRLRRSHSACDGARRAVDELSGCFERANHPSAPAWVSCDRYGRVFCCSRCVLANRGAAPYGTSALRGGIYRSIGVDEAPSERSGALTTIPNRCPRDVVGYPARLLILTGSCLMDYPAYRVSRPGFASDVLGVAKVLETASRRLTGRRLSV